MWIFRSVAGLASLRSRKARAWVEGRKGLFERLEAAYPGGEGARVWMHCASMGEFEQGRPLLDAIRKAEPECRILLTFFSPSGYESRRNHPSADHVEYLPLDTERNAERFLDIVRPDLAVFVKYEFWHHFLMALKTRRTPTILVSAIFRPSQPFFRPYGGFWREMLTAFDRIFVQDEESRRLLTSIGLSDRIEVAGDTRFDRVVAVAGNAAPVPEVEAFCRGHRVLVAGSTWPEDEELLSAYASGHPDLSIIVAPHEVDEESLKSVEERMPGSVRLTDLADRAPEAGMRVLIVDGMGLLSRLYRYADLAYVGGGFKRSGIHNILEAAVYGKPVFFGPNHSKSREARELAALNGAFPVGDVKGLREKADPLLEDPEKLRVAGDVCAGYVRQGAGATERILDHLARKRLWSKSVN